jgi:KUP system potassium uptake protein
MVSADTEIIVGGISAIFWALMIVVSLKDVVLIMRADNRGEGGVMALLALATSSVRDRPIWSTRIALVGLVGVALFYGDAVLTPAISVLSAVEGLEIKTVGAQALRIAHSNRVLIVLFAFSAMALLRSVGYLDRRDIWFLALAALGVRGIVQALRSCNPSTQRTRLGSSRSTASAPSSYWARCCLRSREPKRSMLTWVISVSVPIRIAWFGLVFPASRAELSRPGRAAHSGSGRPCRNPFYLLWGTRKAVLLPMVVLATAATNHRNRRRRFQEAYSLTKQCGTVRLPASL